MPTAKITNGHQIFLKQSRGKRKHYEHLASKGQKPEILWIGCSDSRVVPEHIINAEPGDLFVVRNVGNMVPEANGQKDSVGAAVEFAVNVLNVKHIVVCGHTGCGGVRAALEGVPGKDQNKHLNNWIRQTASLNDFRTGGTIRSEDETLLQAVRANTIVQSERLKTYACVKERLEQGSMHIQALIYDLHTLKLTYYDQSREAWFDLQEEPDSTSE